MSNNTWHLAVESNPVEAMTSQNPESGNPIEFVKHEPLQAGGILLGAVAIAAIGLKMVHSPHPWGKDR